MKFSIIIPSYGQAKYLRAAIESALSQNFTDPYEIIVVDDGSIDGSLKIAQDYEPRIKVVRQVNKGLASARNAGIMNAEGEYCFFLDADDMLLPNALKEIFSRSGFYQDVIVPSIRCLDEKTGKTQDTILIKDPKFEDFILGNRLAYCAAIRRQVLLDLGGYSPKMDFLGGWEDLHLWYNLFNRGKEFTTIQEPLVIYRVKEQSMWKDAEKNKVALWAQIIKDFPEAKDHVKS